ncbi:MAG: hypothetical protein SGILL_003961, partial [Bacillariaceae sp.]
NAVHVMASSSSSLRAAHWQNQRHHQERRAQDETTTDDASSTSDTATNNTDISCPSFGMEAYFLLDLQGRPDLLTAEDITAMETAFVNSYTVQSSACLVMNSATIFQTDIFSSATTGGADGGGGIVTDPDIVLQQRQSSANGTNPIVESDDPVFSVIVYVVGNCTQCQGEEAAAFFQPLPVEEGDQGGNSTTTEEAVANESSQNITLSDPCACPIPFYELFIQQYRDTLVFTTANEKVVNVFNVTEMDVVNPECETTATTAFDTTVLVTLDFDTNQDGQDLVIPSEITAAQRAELERLFVQSYHETNLLNKDLCDPFRRRIEQITLSPDNALLDPGLIPGFDFSGNYVHLLLNVRGLCKDCSNDAVLFDQIDDGSNEYGIPFFRELQQSTETLECLCPIGGVPSRSCNVREFFAQYSTAIDTYLPFAPSLVSVYELDPTFCPNDATPFTSNVLLEVEICPEGTFTGDLDLVQDAFVTVYNSLSLLYCDPNFRVLQNTTVINQEQVTRDGKFVLRLELTVSGSCQNGCDPNTIGIYDFPVPSVIDGRILKEDHDLEIVDLNRRLQDVENCYCAADPIGSRAPSEAEFVRALQNYVTTIIDAQLNCVSGIEECQFGDAFESVLILSFENVGLASAEEAEIFKLQLEESVFSSLESLYEVSDLECPLDVRLIESVEAVLNIAVVTPQREENRRRRFLQTSANTTAPADNSTSSSPSSSPTFSPGSTQNLNAAVFVSGLCDGCEADLLLTNDVSNRRRAAEELHKIAVDRALQEDETFPSYCFCPIGSVVVDEEPTVADFEQSVQTSLQEQGSTAVLVETSESDTEDCDLEDATCLSGRQSFECSDGGTFQVEVAVDLLFGCDDVPDPSDASFSEYQTIANEYIERYNSLQSDYCDVQQKVLTGAEVVQVGETSNVGEVAVVFSLTGTCTNCNGGTSVNIYEFPPAPTIEATLQRRLSGPKKRSSNSRSLQNGNDGLCECTAIGVSDDGFSEAAFIDDYRVGVESLGLQCFVSCGPCEFGTPFTTSLVAQVAPGSFVDTEALQEEFLSQLQATFTSSDDLCNPDNPQFTDAIAQLEFVLNGRAIGFDENGNLPGADSRELQSVPLDELSSAPSAAPTFAIDPAGNETAGNETLVLLTVAGVCDGCETGFTLTNDVLRRLNSRKMRRAEERLRKLQGDTQGECACVPGSDIIQEVPGIQFFDEIQTVDVQAFETLTNIDCDTDPSSLEGKTVNVQFRANGAISTDAYIAELNRLAVYLAEAYDEATNQVCDPFVRKVSSFQLVAYETPSQGSGCQQYSATFSVVEGTCLGCNPQETGLFDDGSSAARRILERSFQPSELQTLVSSYPQASRNLITANSDC